MKISLAESEARKVALLPDLTTSQRAENARILHYYVVYRHKKNDLKRKQREKKERGVRVARKTNKDFGI